MRDKIQVYIDGELTCHHFPRTRTSRSHSGLLCTSWTLEDFFLVWGQGIVSGCFNKSCSVKALLSPNLQPKTQLWSPVSSDAKALAGGRLGDCIHEATDPQIQGTDCILPFYAQRAARLSTLAGSGGAECIITHFRAISRSEQRLKKDCSQPREHGKSWANGKYSFYLELV